MDQIEPGRIILFDGICNLCNSSVRFILKHEKEPVFHFTSIQSEAGQELLVGCGLPRDYTEAMVFIDRGAISLGSTAALKIGQQLRFPWSLVARVALRIPKSLRDYVYHQITLHRYKWFGKKEVCMVPTEDLKARFL